MSDTKIKISGDVTELKKSLLDLAKTAKEIGGTQSTLINPSDKKFINDQLKKALDDSKKKIKENRIELGELLKSQNEVSKSVAKEAEARQKFIQLSEKQVALSQKIKTLESKGGSETELNKLRKKASLQADMARKEFEIQKNLETSLSKEASLRDNILEKAKQQVSLRKDQKSLTDFSGGGGMSGMSGLAMGALGAVGAVGAFAGSRLVGGHNTFSEGLDDRLLLRGRGAEDEELRDPTRAARAGVNSQSMRKLRLNAMDAFGSSGSSQESILGRSEFERGHGIEQGTMTGIGGALRGSLGGSGANKAVMAVQASLIASGIKEEVGPYLQSMTSLLQNISEHGISFSDSASALMASVTAKGGISPERSGKMIGGINDAIKNSSGESNAFFQQVFKKAGIGGNTVGGIQAGIRMGGLFGADVKNSYMSDTDKRVFQHLGIGGRTMGKVGGGTLDALDKAFGSDKDINKLLNSKDKNTQDQGAQKRVGRLTFLTGLLGLHDEGEASTASKLLDDSRDSNLNEGAKKKAGAKLQSMMDGNTDLGNLKAINKSAAGIENILTNKAITVKDSLGAEISPIFQKMSATLINIDMSLSSVLKMAGFTTPGEKLKEGSSGESALTDKDFDSVSSDTKKEFSMSMAGRYHSNAKRLAELQAKANKASHTGKGTMLDLADSKEREEFQTLSQSQGNISSTFNHVKGLDMSGLSKKEISDMHRSSAHKDKSANGKSVAELMETFLDKITGNNYGLTGKDDSVKHLKAIADHTKQNIKATERSGKSNMMMNALPAKSGKS